MSNSDSIDFIGIGMPKCGTSWISKCLSEHPDILFSRQKSSKEIKFFNKEYNIKKGIQWYLKQFPKYHPNKIRGEFTPAYMVDENAHRLIYEFFPDVKLLVVLRCHCDMLYSLHKDWSVCPWIETVDNFEKAVIDGQLDRIGVEFGCYFSSLKKYYNLFPKENIHVILYDDIISDRERVIDQLYEFLTVDKTFRSSRLYDRVNQTVEVRSKTLHGAAKFFIKTFAGTKPINAMKHSPIMNEIIYHGYKRINGKTSLILPPSKQVRQLIAHFFLEDTENLEKLINRDLSAWKKV